MEQASNLQFISKLTDKQLLNIVTAVYNSYYSLTTEFYRTEVKRRDNYILVEIVKRPYTHCFRLTDFTISCWGFNKKYILPVYISEVAKHCEDMGYLTSLENLSKQQTSVVQNNTNSQFQ